MAPIAAHACPSCRANHCFAEFTFGFGASQERISDEAQRCGVAKVFGLRLLEAGRKFVSVVDDFLGSTWHRIHLRYFGRAGTAWTVIGPSALSTTPA